MCENKGPTITIFKSAEFHRIFGSYTNIPWKKDPQWKFDVGESFLFSVRNDGTIKKLKFLH